MNWRPGFQQVGKQWQAPRLFENPDADIEGSFQKLVAKWKRETEFVSSMSDVIAHPAYLQIIAMGKRAVPLLLRELETRPDHWFCALNVITGENPVAAADVGNTRRMTDAWLRWGREHRYL